ncbi:MAG: hypothetical protein ACKO68_08570 [Bacteroidota bacterium]
MRKNNINRFFFVLCLLILGCANPPKQVNVSVKGVSQYSQWLSYCETPVGIQFTIKDPEGKQAPRTFLCTKYPEKVGKISANLEVINTQNVRLATNAATHVGMLVSLQAQDQVGAVSLGKFLYDPQLKMRFKQGKLLELGNTDIPFESLVKQGISLWISVGMQPLEDENIKRFESLGITWIPNYDWREMHPLGKAEWILLFGALTNRFDQAKKTFEAICKRYKAYDNLPKGNACQKVLVGNFAGEFWYAPLKNSFQAQFLTQVDFCTFTMNYPGTGSMAVGAERVFKEAESCTLWLNPGFSSKNDILTSFPKASVLRPFKESRIFCYSHDLNKYWEQSALMPDIVLRDLIRIKQGQTTTDKLYFYREVL